jgi:hypothetical protein
MEYSNNYLKDLVLNFSVKKLSIWENIFLAAITFHELNSLEQ